VIHWAARYDALVWLLTLGRERSFRERLIAPAKLEPGESVLDVGCGTGTLAVVAKRQVGARGSVHGIDPSGEMIERARKKAARAGAEVAYRTGYVQALPYADASFDAVLSTLMMHHLPRAARQDAVREMRRALKPGGRALIVDFGARASGKRSFIGHLHRHGHVKLDEIADVLDAGGLSVVDRGPVGARNLYFAIGRAPAA
jgi:ubiquinone/menaquinone biosynthesis C-methylase UbiE